VKELRSPVEMFSSASRKKALVKKKELDSSEERDLLEENHTRHSHSKERRMSHDVHDVERRNREKYL